MKSSLNDFISLVRKTGLLTSTHFYVFIPTIGDKDLMMMCDATTIPGMNLMTTENRVFGEITETPHSILYAPVSLSFYLDREMSAKKRLDGWMNQVVDRTTRKIGFYGDYTRDVDLFITDKMGDTVYCIRLHEAYPKHIGDIPLAYAGETVLKIDVTLTYKWSSVQTVTTNGETVATTNGNLSNTNPYNSRTFDKTIGPDSIGRFANYRKIENEFNLTPEGLSNRTGILPSGSLDLINTVPSLDFSGRFTQSVGNFSSRIRGEFGRAGNMAAAAIGASGLEASLANQMIIGSKAISRDMWNYAGGMSQLGASLNAIAMPISNITTSMFSLGNSLGIVNNALDAHGLGRPFTSSINSINRHASQLAVVSTLNGIPGQLSGFGSALSATGSIFNETIHSLRSAPGYNNQVESAVRNMGSTFINGGTNTQNLAADLNSRILSGEIYDN
jgi:hypothetical protein